MFKQKIERKYKQRARIVSTQKATTNKYKAVAEGSNLPIVSFHEA